ncbi:hypothetical protein IM098_005173 [Escherichia coli]|nr:hypothetical protein [Escherichia coli]EGJ4597601.1 hypothetical protein [Escherichia coli]EGJ4726820.1 hypothetical protein [Escherichia coli]
MSIDIRCYTTLTVPDLQMKLELFLLKNSHVFPKHYSLYKAHSLGPFDKDISIGFGLDPKSFFRVHANNKKFEISTDEIADMIRDELGEKNVIVLLNGEEII